MQPPPRSGRLMRHADDRLVKQEETLRTNLLSVPQPSEETHSCKFWSVCLICARYVHFICHCSTIHSVKIFKQINVRNPSFKNFKWPKSLSLFSPKNTGYPDRHGENSPPHLQLRGGELLLRCYFSWVETTQRTESLDVSIVPP